MNNQTAFVFLAEECLKFSDLSQGEQYLEEFSSEVYIKTESFSDGRGTDINCVRISDGKGFETDSGQIVKRQGQASYCQVSEIPVNSFCMFKGRVWKKTDDKHKGTADEKAVLANFDEHIEVHGTCKVLTVKRIVVTVIKMPDEMSEKGLL